MRKFEHKTDFKHVYEIMCYAHNPEVQSATLPELEEFLQTLLRHFPHRKLSEDGSVKPYEETNSYMQQWRAAHDHILRLISERKATRRFKFTIWVSGATLLVLMLTLVFQIYTAKNFSDSKDTPVENVVTKKTLNKPMQPTANASAD